MPLPNTKFQIHASQDLKRDVARLKYLTELDRVARLEFDDTDDLFKDPQDVNFAGVDTDAYNDLMQKRIQEFDDNEYQALLVSVPQLRNQHQAAYNQLKQQLQQDVNGDPNHAQSIDFDDNELRVDVAYSFRECMDRFGATAKNQIKTVLGYDPNAQQQPKLQDVFRDELGTDAVKQSFEGKYDDVLNDYRQKGNTAFNDPTNVPDLSNAATGTDCVNSLLGSQPGLCLDDDHGTADSKDFLINNMAAMKQQGVDTLFVEHFWTDYQPQIDQYLQGQPNDPVPEPLNGFITRVLDGGQQQGKFRTMLATAKQNQVRIVGLDSFESKTREDGDPRKWDQRAAKFNADAADIVNREKGNSKFVLMAGAAHNNTHFSGFPGLAQILGVPAVEPAPGGKLAVSPDKEKANRGVRSEAQQAFYDEFIVTFRQQNPNADAMTVMNAATAVTRKQGKALDRLKPEAARRLGNQSAARATQQLTQKNLTINTGQDLDILVQEVEAEDNTFKQELVNLKTALQTNNKNEVLRILKAHPNDDRFLIAGMDGVAGMKADQSLLHAAAKNGHKLLAKLLIQRGFDPDCKDDNGDTPLNSVFKLGDNAHDADHTRVVTQLLSGGARIDVPNKQGRTPVHGAVATKSLDLMKKFGNKPGFKEAQQMPDGDGKMPLHLAIDNGDDKAFKDLYAQVRKKGLDPKTFRVPPKNQTLLHYAAAKNDPKIVQRLLTRGFLATDADADGNTPLHSLIVEVNTDVDAVSEKLLQGGGSLATPNAAGETPLHKALGLKFNATPPFQKWLANHKDDFKQAALVNKGNLRVLDLVIARGDAALEDEMYDQQVVPDTPAVVLGPNETKTTPEILHMATVYDDPTVQQQGLDHYQKLYEDYPEFRSTLDLAALKAMGNRRRDKGLRILMVNADSPGKITTGGGTGAYDPRNHSLALGIDRDPTQLMGSMIHEMTHYAVNVVYDNDTQPFPKTGTKTKNKYHQAIEKDVLKGHLALGKEEKEFQRTLNERMQVYEGRPNGQVNLNQEFIASIPQILVTHGRDMLERRGGGLIQFWDDTICTKVSQKVAQDPNQNKIAPVNNDGQPYTPDSPWVEHDTQVTNLGDDIANIVLNETRVRTGNRQPGGILIDATRMKHPREIQLGTKFIADTNTIPELWKKLEEVKNDSTYSESGWYDEIRQLAENALALDPNTSRDDLVDEIEKINEKIRAGNAKNKPFRDALSKIRQRVADKIATAKQNGKLPEHLHDDVVRGFVKTMADEMGPVLETVDQMIENDDDPTDIEKEVAKFEKKVGKKVGTFAQAARKAHKQKDEIDERNQKKADYRHKLKNNLPMTDQEFAEAVVLQAEERKYARNPPPDGVPMTVNKKKHAKLIERVAAKVHNKPKNEDLFKKATRVVVKKALTKKTPKIGSPDLSHVSVQDSKNKKRQWMLELAQL